MLFDPDLLLEKVRENHHLVTVHAGEVGVWLSEGNETTFVCLSDVLEDINLSHATYAKFIDSDDPEDHIDFWGVGHKDPQTIILDAKSGRIRNWEKIKEHLKCEDAHHIAEAHVLLAELNVASYRRKNGQIVKAHKRHHDHIGAFIGIAKTTKHAQPSKSNEAPATSDEWHVYKHKDTEVNGKKLAGRPFLAHPETGDLAPSGTETENVESYKGKSMLGYVQRGNFAAGRYNEDDRWAKKTDDLLSMIKSETALSHKVRADLSEEGWPKNKLCAIVTLLMNRHTFRVGGADAMTNTNKGRNAEGQIKEANYESTYGITTLLKEHVRFDQFGQAEFIFVGKSGKDWYRIETDKSIVDMIKTLVDEADDDSPVFRIRDADIREYLAPFGFRPHKFRTYWASYLFFKTVSDLVKQHGEAKTKSTREAYLKAGVKVAAEKLNDGENVTQNSYVHPALIEQLLNTGEIANSFGLKDYHLAEQYFGWWLPDEDKFHAWIASVGQTDGQVNLSEIVVYLSGPWPELQPGDRWVTLKPHGPDSEDYHRVIIREHPDGSAHVVWAGHKGLEHLKLTHRGTRDEIERAEGRRNTNRALTSEEKQQQVASREHRKNEQESEKSTFGAALAQELGVSEEHGLALADAVLKKQVRTPGEAKVKTDEELELEKQAQAERLQKLLESDLPDIPAADPKIGVPPERALAEASVSEMLGELPNTMSDVAPEVQEAWDQIRRDPDAMRRIAGLKSKFQSRLREIHKNASPGRGSIRVHERMAFYDDPQDNELALLSDAQNRARYQMNSRFWHLNSGGETRDGEEQGLGAGAHDYFYQGATDALTVINSRFSISRKVNPGVLQELGPEVVAAAVAASILDRGGTVAGKAAKLIEGDIAKQGLPTVMEALSVAQDADVERERIRSESTNGMLTDAARINALKNQTVRKQKALARAAGSLEAAAQVADWLRTGVGEGITINPGDKLDAVRERLESVGLREDEGYELRHGGSSIGIFVPAANLSKILQVSDNQVVRDEEVKSIKDHKSNTSDFSVPGLKEGIKLKDQQQATIRFFEKQKIAFGNVGVGLGKTITFGSAAARLIASGKAKSGWYVVPTNLLANTMNELRDKFPGLTIEVAHPDFNPKAKDKEGRRSLYDAEDRPHIMLIGQDTIRNDAESLASACDGPNAPGFIFGDEVHSMFTPGESGDAKNQSQRSAAMKRLRAPYMLAMTGTPIRRSSAEVWKVLDWLKPGQFGSLSNWMLRYGKIGQGVSAYSEAVNNAFQHEIDPIAITETDKPNVDIHEHVRKVDLSSDQMDAYKAEQDKYDAARTRPGADVRNLSARKVINQREVIYTGNKETNSVLKELHADLGPHLDRGERGVIHCTSVKAVKAVAASFKPGIAVTYTGDDALTRRNAIVSSINDGTLLTGGRAKADDGTEGVITNIGEKTVKIKTDEGEEKSYDRERLESMVALVVGTSTAVGVVSTGLNLQKGANVNAHFQLPDSAATYRQRQARTMRTGQTRDVSDYTYVPETPATREHFQRLKEQDKLMQAFDDPTDYDEDELFELMQGEEGNKNAVA